jgi:hypothetical protein
MTRIKTPIGTAWLDEHGILWHRLDFGARVSGELAQRTTEVLADLFDGRKAPAIVDIGELQFADKDARDVFARLGANAPETATAILVKPAENPASGIHAFLFSTMKPDRPVGVFESEAEAVAWAKRFVPGT